VCNEIIAFDCVRIVLGTLLSYVPCVMNVQPTCAGIATDDIQSVML
jgi:hypothetical protein